MPAVTWSLASSQNACSRAPSPRWTTRRSCGPCRPDVLHADLVLVGEEVRQPVVGRAVAEHRPRGGRALVQRVGPVLDADVAVVARVEGVRDVAGGEDVRGARPEVARRRRSRRRSRGRRPARARCRGPRRRRRPRRRTRRAPRRRARTRSTALAALDPLDRRPRPHADAVVAVDRRRSARRARGRGRARAASRRPRSASPPRRGARALAATSQPIQPAPMTRHAAAGDDRVLERVRVGERAQDVHAPRSDPVDRRAAGHRAGGDQQPVVRRGCARRRASARARSASRPVARTPAMQLDRVLLVEPGGMDVGVVARACRRRGSPWRAAGARTAARAPPRRARRGPSKPSSRSVSAAFAPARPAPTMTNVRGSDTAASCGEGEELLAGARVVADEAVQRATSRCARPASARRAATCTGARPPARRRRPWAGGGRRASGRPASSGAPAPGGRARSSSTTRASFDSPMIRSPGR